MLKPSSTAEITAKIKKLKVGGSFTIASPNERKYALDAARVLGKRIITRKQRQGFLVMALP